MNSIKWGRIAVFVIMSYSISWLIWFPNVLSYNFDVNWGTSKWLHILGGLGPVSGALITTFIFEGKSGIKRFIDEKYGKNLSFMKDFISQYEIIG